MLLGDIRGTKNIHAIPFDIFLSSFSSRFCLTGHELDEVRASRLLNTVRLLLPVASKVSHDPEDEYLTELFQDLFGSLKRFKSS